MDDQDVDADLTPRESISVAGTFEYIEAKIRRDAEGTTFGGDFEWLCQWSHGSPDAARTREAGGTGSAWSFSDRRS